MQIVDLIRVILISEELDTAVSSDPERHNLWEAWYVVVRQTDVIDTCDIFVASGHYKLCSIKLVYLRIDLSIRVENPLDIELCAFLLWDIAITSSNYGVIVEGWVLWESKVVCWLLILIHSHWENLLCFLGIACKEEEKLTVLHLASAKPQSEPCAVRDTDVHL